MGAFSDDVTLEIKHSNQEESFRTNIFVQFTAQKALVENKVALEVYEISRVNGLIKYRIILNPIAPATQLFNSYTITSSSSLVDALPLHRFSSSLVLYKKAN